MTVSEHKVLSEVDAKNNPLYFNKTNGAPKYRPIDIIKVKELVIRNPKIYALLLDKGIFIKYIE